MIFQKIIIGFVCLSVVSCSTVTHNHFAPSDNMNIYAFRLQPGQDLKKELDAYALANKLEAGFVVTCVGSLQRATLRLANQPGPSTYLGKYEIVSLVGTFSPDGSHLHIALSDSTGATIGGHLMAGCEVYTTAEIVLGSASNLKFSRITDPKTTFKELEVHDKK